MQTPGWWSREPAGLIQMLLGAGTGEVGEVCDGDPQCLCKGRQMVVGGSV